MARRPGIGTMGRRIQVSANAFPITSAPNFNVYHYDVTVHPEKVPSRVKRQVLAHLFATERAWADKWAVYDGNKNVFVPRARMPFESHKFRIILPEEDGRERRPPRDGQPPRENAFTIDVQFAAEINLHSLQAFCSGQTQQDNSSLMSIVALNVLLRHEASIANVCKGASIYPAPTTDADRFVIMGGIEMWRGYFSSLRPSPNRLIVNVDSTAMPFIQPGDLVRVMSAYLNISDPARLAQLPDSMRVRLGRFLKGLKVKVMVGATRQPAERKIKAYDPTPAASRSFKDDQGNELTIQVRLSTSRSLIAQNYFRAMNINLRFPQLGCVRVTKTAWYPLECVTVLPGTKYTSKLSPDQVAKVLEFTSKRPKEKRDLIRAGLAKLGYDNNRTVQDWGLRVGNEPLTMNARVLQPPQLLAGGPNKAQATVRCKDDGQFDARRVPFFKPAAIQSMLVIVFDTQQGDGRRNRGVPQQAVQSMVTMLVQACTTKGMQVATPNPPIAYIGDVASADVGKTFFQVITNECGGKKPQLILCFLPSKTAPQYNTIKRLGDTLQGFATQCMVIEKAIKRDASYFQNVALKINPKLGGVNQILATPYPVPGVKDPATDPIIIFGADVAHPGPGSTSPSIAGVVATSDIHAASYSTQTRPQNMREEVIIDLEEMVNQLLKDFYKLSKKQPTRIIFYRDGVSEGQFAQVVVKEVAAIRSACQRLDANYRPKLTFIVCGKRHHIRFFPTVAPPPGAKGPQLNVPPGTVVDEGVVHPSDFDFYAVHHAGMLGTSRPTHYSVLVDENNFTADQIQDMTNKTAWMYQRCAKAVSLCSPAYFAHLACTRAKAHLDAARSTDDDTVTATTDSERADAIRANMLSLARQDLKPIHTALLGTMPWSVSSGCSAQLTLRRM